MLARALSAAVVLAACTIAAHPAAAVTQDPGQTDYEILLPLEQTLYLHKAEQIGTDAAARQYETRLAQELGVEWRVVGWNQFAESPRLVEGPGLVVAPGGLADATELQVEQLARSVIATYPDVFGSNGANLELVKVAHGGGKWGVAFQQVEAGIPVMHSAVLLALTDEGKLFGFGANQYRNIDISLTPTIERQVATALARSAVPYDPTADLQPGEDAMLIVPIHQAPGQVEYHLVHRTDVPSSQPMGIWRTYVDAHDGEIILRTNEIDFAYEGSVQGDVEIYSYCDGITPDSPYARMYVSISGVGTATTDDSGNFTIPGNIGTTPFSAVFNGTHFSTLCDGCGGNAQISGSIAPDSPELIYFDDASFRPDERDAFYWANQTRIFINSIDPAFNLTKYTIVVDYPDNCNATHSWSQRRLRFYEEGSGCANTGRIGDVVAHEYGHGIQGYLLGAGSQGQQGLGEGNSDICGNFMTGRSQVGIGFNLNQCTTGLFGRNCDNNLIYPDDLTGQVHNDGRIICGFNWDVWRNLADTYGEAQGKEITSNLWHFSRANWGLGSMIQPDQVLFYLWADDDNGDLTDGTPNWDDICEAATKHGYDCPPNPNRIEIAHTPLADRIDPTGPYTVAADVSTYITGNLVATDNVEIWYAVNGGAYQMTPMSNTSGTTWEGGIPGQAAGSAITYYLRATHPSGLEEFFPEDAPDDNLLFGVGPYTVIVDEDMEVDTGWTVGAPGDNATQGIWERADPVAIVFSTTIFTPEDDHTPDPGVNAWITENGQPGDLPTATDLDGRTTLISPTYDFGSANLVQGSFWVWTYLLNVVEDYVRLEMSTDGGASWSEILTHQVSTTPDWQEVPFRLSPADYNFTSQTQFRFVAEDVGVGSIVEVLIDDFVVEGLVGGTTAVAGPQSSSPLTLGLGDARPNPFNPSTEIAYTLPTDTEVALAIYDVRGRMIRRLVEGRQQAGEHSVRWDGTDAGGVAAASGVYFYRLTVGDWNETRSMVLLK